MQHSTQRPVSSTIQLCIIIIIIITHNEPTKDTTKNANNLTQYSLTLIWTDTTTDTIGSKDRTAEESQCSLTALWTDNGNNISKDPLAEETQCSLTALWTDISDTKGDDRNEEIHESVIDISYEDTEETLPYIEFFLNIFKKNGVKNDSGLKSDEKCQGY